MDGGFGQLLAPTRAARRLGVNALDVKAIGEKFSQTWDSKIWRAHENNGKGHKDKLFSKRAIPLLSASQPFVLSSQHERVLGVRGNQ